MDLIETFKK